MEKYAACFFIYRRKPQDTSCQTIVKWTIIIKNDPG